MPTTSNDKRRTKVVVFTDDLVHQLRQYDRKPFTDLLAAFMNEFPSREAITRFAEAYPDRYMSALAQLSRIAGFTDKTETSVNININVAKLSDSQLEDQIAEISKRLDLPAAEFHEIKQNEPMRSIEKPNRYDR